MAICKTYLMYMPKLMLKKVHSLLVRLGGTQLEKCCGKTNIVSSFRTTNRSREYPTLDSYFVSQN